MSAMLDTLAFARELRDGGFDDRQAETLATAMGRAASAADVATKADIDRLNGKVETVEKTLRAEIEALARDLRNEIKLLEQRLTIRIGIMMATMFSIAFAAARLLWH